MANLLTLSILLLYTGEKIVTADDHCSLFYVIVGGEVVVEKKHKPTGHHLSPKMMRGAGGVGMGGTPAISPRGGKDKGQGQGQGHLQGHGHGQGQGSSPPMGSKQRRDRGLRRGSDVPDNASVSEGRSG